MSIHREKIQYIRPGIGDKLVQQHILHQTGQPNLSARLDHAKTLFDHQGRAKRILIDATLPTKIRRVFLHHERVQLKVIQEWVRSSPGRTMTSVMPAAHFAGLEAGYHLAEKLGVLHLYKKIRGEI